MLCCCPTSLHKLSQVCHGGQVSFRKECLRVCEYVEVCLPHCHLICSLSVVTLHWLFLCMQVICLVQHGGILSSPFQSQAEVAQGFGIDTTSIRVLYSILQKSPSQKNLHSSLPVACTSPVLGNSPTPTKMQWMTEAPVLEIPDLVGEVLMFLVGISAPVW